MKYNLGGISKIVIGFLVRISVIVHELSHLLFVLISGGKVNSMELFNKEGGNVNFSMPDYLGNAVYNKLNFWYILYLFGSRIAIFSISLAPLMIGVVLVFLIFYFGFGVSIWHLDTNLLLSSEFSIIFILLFGIFCLIIFPGFLLSFQDISNLLIYRSDSFLASFFGSLFNLIFLVLFLILLALFFIDILFFIVIFYSLVFVLLLFLVSIVFFYKKLVK